MIYAIICSRSDRPSKALSKLLKYLDKCKIHYHVSYDALSMFEGYLKGLDELRPNPDDIVIFCHDDIEILMDTELFVDTLTNSLKPPEVGFVGPAGTTHLGLDAVWWDMHKRTQGLHSGFVFQGQDPATMTPNYFGACRNVVVLDGLFLAAKKSTLDRIDLKKPDQFKSNWDFYDLYYTLSAYETGFTNKAIPLLIMHYSNGEMRESWNQNRMAFQKMFRLPVKCYNGTPR